MDSVLESTADDLSVDLPDVMVIDLTPLMLRSARDSVITCVELGRELSNQQWTSVVMGLRVFVPVTGAKAAMESKMRASAFADVPYSFVPGSQVAPVLPANDAERLFALSSREARMSVGPPTVDPMTAIPDRPNTALLIVDMQRGVVIDGSYNRDVVIANIAELVAKARDQDVPVVWVVDHGEDRTPGSEPWQLVPELGRTDDEPLVDKGYGDSFEGTDLEDVLAKRGVGRLFVTGAQTDACIRSTIHGAFARGYDVTLVEDAHTTEDLTPYGSPVTPDQAVAYTNMYWKYQSAPERRGGTVPAAEVNFHDES